MKNTDKNTQVPQSLKTAVSGSAIDNLNEISKTITSQSIRILKEMNAESEIEILKIVQGRKPEHLTDEQWKRHIEVGNKLILSFADR